MRAIVIILMILGLLPFYSEAQHNFSMYSMTKMGQAHYENPAYVANGNVYIGIGLGHHSIGLNHSGFRINKTLKQRSYDDSLMFDQEALKNSLWKRNTILMDMRNELLGVGFRVKKNYFSLSVTNRMNLAFVYPKDLIVLGLEGNGGSLLGQRASLDGLGLHADGYVEYAVGYNREINDKLRVGGRIKLLSGYANFATKKSKLGLTTDEETFDLTVDGQFKFASSGFGGLISDSLSDEEFDFKTPYNFKNFGIALDLGGTYQLTDKIGVSASLLDFGFIKWKNQVASYQTDDLSFRFEGVDINQFLSDSTDYLERVVDTLIAKVDNDITTDPYSTMVSTRFYIGGTYKVTDWFTAGVTTYNQFIGRRLRSSLIVSGTIQLKNWLGFTANYSIYGRSFGNIGLGLTLRGGPIQFYVMTDNILAINYWGTKNAHVSFGLNLLIGKPDKLKQSKASFGGSKTVQKKEKPKNKNKQPVNTPTPEE